MADQDNAAKSPDKKFATEPAPKPAPGAGAEDSVEVKQLRPYYNGPNDDHRQVAEKPYSVPRLRAAELRARGLVAYVKDEDGEHEAEEASRKAREAVRSTLTLKKKD